MSTHHNIPLTLSTESTTMTESTSIPPLTTIHSINDFVLLTSPQTITQVSIPTGTSTIKTTTPKKRRKHQSYKKRSYVVFGSLKSLYNEYSHKINTINRCGVILYYDSPNNGTTTTTNNTTNITNTSSTSEQSKTFIFAVDRKTRELTDMGGGVLPTDPSLISTAIRETREESLGIFDEFLPPNYKFNQLALYERAWSLTDFKTLIIFWKIQEPDKNLIIQEFKQRVTNIKCPEVIGVEWISTDQLETLIFPETRKSKMTRVGGLTDCPCNLVPKSDSITAPAGCIRIYDKVLKLLQSANTNFSELP